ncbi:MAG: LPS export ABC transporter permease LptG [candidate division KSB1 bacterium]|nr:LPS export ABC transporter permease LptG [candidate division KSB1 bacterium]
MRILDRYVTRKFLQVLFFSLLAFVIIFIVVDLIENLDRYIDNKFPRIAVIEYYINFLPFIIVLILPVAMLLSSLYSIGGLARNNEIVAMKAAGLSLYRIFLPVLITALFISFLSMWIADRLVPRATQRQSEINEHYLRNRPPRKRLDNVYLRDEQDRRISMRSFNTETFTGSVVSIRRMQDSRLISRIDARRMVWQDSLWMLYDGYERTFTEEGEKAEPFTARPLETTSIRPENISRLLRKPEEMSYRELKDFIAEVKRNGADPAKWLVDLHLKIALPFANFIIVLFGLPLSAAQTRRSGAAKGFGVSLAVTFVYFGILKTTQAMGHTGKLDPIVAAWFANVVFGILGLIVLWKAKK